MSKYFRPWNIDQTLLLPPNVQDFGPKGIVSRFIVELVRESLDLKEITGSYVSGLGQPPFDPRMIARAAVMVIFAIVLSVAMLAAFITTIEGEKHVSNSAHPGTIGLAKPHPPLDKAPGEPVRN